MIILIAAISDNFALGKNNQMLWHLPDDFKRFRALTTGYPIIMGRKTFESLPRMLPGRKHIIISRQKDFQADDCIVVHSVEDALKIIPNGTDGYVIGGGEIYKQALQYADKLELTCIAGNFDADAFFPEFDETRWKLVSEVPHPADERHSFSFTFKTYIRKFPL